MDHKDFKIKSPYKPTADQSKAINKLVSGIKSDKNYQTLLGVTGSGKTFTVANIIEKTQMPALIISHNKTLAAQLYQEFKSFFPNNAVSYFVSYYDYYQPEAYIPSTDTYIEKDAGINDLIDKLRLAATTNLLTRKDSLVIASVSCIYNIGSPKEYGKFILELATKVKVTRDQIIDRLLDLQYSRGEFGFHRGTFRVMGDTISIYPAYLDNGVQIELKGDYIESITLINTTTGEELEKLDKFTLFPAKHFMTNPKDNKAVFKKIRSDLKNRISELKKQGKKLEAHRLKQKVTYDLEMIEEVGYVKGIENYSRYFDGRKPGEAPNTLIDYFNESFGNKWLLIADESHITFPQVRGMYRGDQSRKTTLISYGFRLPASLDNRPLTFDEFMRKIPGFIATSATPDDWEKSISQKAVVEQLVRPTGIPDPQIDIRPTKHQVKDVIKEVKKRAKLKERTLITTLTKKTAEDLSEYLSLQGLKVQYLHSDIKTLDRTDILDDLRSGKYDCLVGINLLREGLDLPEVTLVAILDADKEGFLRSETSLVQTMGRAARHVKGEVIMYADHITDSMQRAIKEVNRRRKIQLKYNKKHNITPKTITKPIREKLIDRDIVEDKKQKIFTSLPDIDSSSLTPLDKKKLMGKLQREMRLAANDLNFELAIEIRNKIRDLK